MKVWLLLVCAVAGSEAGNEVGTAVAWPPASVVRTVVPPQTKTVAYSTTQYINSVPSLSYSVGVQPHFGYQFPQVSAFSPVQTYYPIAGASYFPSSSIFYPSVAPIASQQPIASFPSFPAGFPAGFPSGIPAGIPAGTPTGQAPSAPAENPASDSDSEVVDSANAPQQQDDQPAQDPAPSQPPAPQAPPSNVFPSFPQIPQIPNPSFPQIPQEAFPGFPQFPQLPSNPLFPQNPSPSPPSSFPSPSPPSSFPSPSPPSSFPGASNDDRGLNDEDTISVESA